MTIFLGACAAQQGVAESRPSRSIEDPTQTDMMERVKYEDAVYNEDIRTVQIYPAGNPLDFPIITFGSGQFLELHFDHMGGEIEQYYYKLIHCTADWQPSELNEMQYLEGFFTDIITDFNNSFTTSHNYVHYRLPIPNPNLQPKLSGNYIVLVYTDYQEEEPVLTRRFMLVSPKVSIQPFVRQSAKGELRNTSQLIDFEVQHPSFPIDNPFRDVQAVVLQNYRWSEARTDLAPVFLRNNAMEYRYEQGNEFWAGNEFRRFNINNLNQATEEIQAIYRDSIGIRVLLEPDVKRNIRGYRTLRDVNGQYLIQNNLGFDNDSEAEYVDVTFRLRWPEYDSGRKFHVYGSLTDWDIKPEFAMSYYPEQKEYRATVRLKQGYYEYEYVESRGFGTVDRYPVEGSFFETENTYTIFIYHRDIGLGHDALIGVKTFSTQDFF